MMVFRNYSEPSLYESDHMEHDRRVSAPASASTVACTCPPPPPQSHLHASVVNTDSAVLRPENQLPTHVTPRIAALATGEHLVILGRRLPVPPHSMKAKTEAQKESLVPYYRQSIKIEKN
ncbi:hypothetical protein BGW80DRAFT_1310275 [Lactifluus volemus]|nr:hypothetical protein BGW80DRAFT_1310275 [Lactifluus volemus]